jgi:DNA gyrase/topoisomerase IV subunit B
MTAPNGTAVERVRYRGLGTITPAVLERYCVNSSTRKERRLTVEDAAMAVKVFGLVPSLSTAPALPPKP